MESAKDTEKRLSHSTDLFPERNELLSTLSRLIHEQQSPNSVLMMLHLQDIHNLHGIYPYPYVDAIIETIARFVKQSIRKTDFLFRVGEYEFALILPELKSKCFLTLAIHKIQQALAHAVYSFDKRISVNGKFGVVFYETTDNEPLDIIRNANFAVHEAIRHDQDHVVHETHHTDLLEQQYYLKSALKRAIENSEFELYLQPKYSVKENGFTSAEALIRWHEPKFGTITPDLFIPFAEQNGMIHPLTEWVLTNGILCRQEIANYIPKFNLSLNVSINNLRDNDFVSTLAQLIELWCLAPETLCLEITETATMDEPETLRQTLLQLHDFGVRLSIDDFGTGYSSLSYLHKLPIDELKIDQSFIKDVVSNRANQQIVRTIVDLAKNFGLHVVAEGVENKEIMNFLIDLGCDSLQGYHFSIPLPQQEFIAFLQKGNSY
ncbi:MAG: GGDEF domain-containing phosphodiesterase [Pseudomonadota bacterium]